MTRGGVRRSTAAVVTVAVLGVPVLSGLAASCAPAVDTAYSVQNRLGRIVLLADADVRVPTEEQGARITVVLDDGLDDAGVVALVAEVDGAARAEAYPSYRLEVRETGRDDVLVVDDTFAADRRATEVVGRWRRAAGALLGPTTLTYQDRRAAFRIASGAALAHDVTEASRLGPALPRTSWRFDADGATVLLDGRVGAGDVLLVQQVQRDVGSPSHPVPAASWRLELRSSQVELGVEADVGPLPRAALTVGSWGDRLAPLTRAAAAAVAPAVASGPPTRPAVLRLWQTATDGTDVFAWWTSGRAPAVGRDRLLRGWDAWLTEQVAQSRR